MSTYDDTRDELSELFELREESELTVALAGVSVRVREPGARFVNELDEAKKLCADSDRANEISGSLERLAKTQLEILKILGSELPKQH